jgi:hypothetical protein
MKHHNMNMTSTMHAMTMNTTMMITVTLQRQIMTMMPTTVCTTMHTHIKRKKLHVLR